eukprot:scaffold18239_cov112-Isochrysis_galbana.AAC.3
MKLKPPPMSSCDGMGVKASPSGGRCAQAGQAERRSILAAGEGRRAHIAVIELEPIQKHERLRVDAASDAAIVIDNGILFIDVIFFHKVQHI